jgi:hypothetical protein
MDKHQTARDNRHEEAEVDREDEIRRLLDEPDNDHETFNPRTGVDPGLLPLTEDPHERRRKRTTM